MGRVCDLVLVSRVMGIAPLVQNRRLQSQKRAPDYPAIERVLAERFGNWTIDAEHADVLATVDEEHGEEPHGLSGETLTWHDVAPLARIRPARHTYAA